MGLDPVLRSSFALILNTFLKSSLVDADYWLAAVGTRLVALTDGGVARKTVGTLPGTVTALQFSSPTAGWAQVLPQIFERQSSVYSFEFGSTSARLPASSIKRSLPSPVRASDA